MEFVSSEDVTYMGVNRWRDGTPLFGLKRLDRRQHVYVVGKSGTGKSTALRTMILQDLKLSEGVAVLDPHGDLAEELLDYIPARRVNDVVYVNPADQDYPVALNIFEGVPPDDPAFGVKKALVASGVVSVFKKLWADSWGPRLEHILRNAILALLETPGSTLLGLPRLLTDEDYRLRVVRRVRDLVVRSFWEGEFAAYGKTFRVEALSPIQNKVGQFLSSPVIRNIVSQPKSTIDLRRLMDEGKILIVNLSKGRIGEDASALLGALFLTKLQLAAMERAELAEESRRDFWLYVDEFQSFATEAFATILSEARKYRLGLTMSHQYLAQLPEALRAAVFGNVGTLVAFRVGAEDAEALEREFEPQFKRHDLVGLPNHQASIKMTVDGVPGLPFSMGTVVPTTTLHEGNRDKIIRVSRERYSTERHFVEDKLKRWMLP